MCSPWGQIFYIIPHKTGNYAGNNFYQNLINVLTSLNVIFIVSDSTGSVRLKQILNHHNSGMSTPTRYHGNSTREDNYYAYYKPSQKSSPSCYLISFQLFQQPSLSSSGFCTLLSKEIVIFLNKFTNALVEFSCSKSLVDLSLYWNVSNVSSVCRIKFLLLVQVPNAPQIL